MHIAFLTVKNIHHPGAIETYTREVGRRLAARGHRVVVYSMGHHGPRESAWEGMRIVRVPSVHRTNAEKFSASAAAALHLIAGRRPDLAHLHSVAAGALGPLLRARGIPCLLQMHGLVWQRASLTAGARRALRGLEHLSMNAATACAAVSQDQCSYLAARYARHVENIPAGASLTDPPAPDAVSALGLAPGDYSLFVGRLCPEKGLHHLVEALHAMRRDETLVVAGDAAGMQDYKTQLLRLGGADRRIKWLGRVEAALIDPLIAHARLFVLPSEQESFSQTLLTAMSYGRPCLVSDLPANLEAIGGAGVKFASGSSCDLAAKWAWMLDHPRDVAGLGELARMRIARQFTWDVVVTRLESSYTRLLRRQQTGARPQTIPVPAASNRSES